MSSIHQFGHDTMVTYTFTNNCFTHRADSHAIINVRSWLNIIDFTYFWSTGNILGRIILCPQLAHHSC